MPFRVERWREQQRMKNRRITLHVFLVLLTAALAVVWTTRSHANSHPIVASVDESPVVVNADEQPNSGEPDGGQIGPPVKPTGCGAHVDREFGLTRSDLLRWTWMYWRTVIGRFAP